MAGIREQNEHRFAQLETRMESAERSLGQVKRKADDWAQTCDWVIEGSEAVEKLFKEKTDGEKTKWGELKKDLLTVLVPEVARQIGVT